MLGYAEDANIGNFFIGFLMAVTPLVIYSVNTSGLIRFSASSISMAIISVYGISTMIGGVLQGVILP